MREILFRGKQIKNGEWVEGYLCRKYLAKIPHDRLAIMYKTEYDPERWKPDYMTADIIPETVGQYTGLTDKNGKKIFEGDIINHPIGTFVVVFLNGAFCCSLVKEDYLTELCSIHNQCEIIGNRHEITLNC